MSSKLYQVIGSTIRLSDGKVELRLARRTVIQPVPEIFTHVDPIDSSQLEYVAGHRPFFQPIDLNPASPISGPFRGEAGGSGSSGSYAGGVAALLARAPVLAERSVIIYGGGGDSDLEIGPLYFGTSGSGGGFYSSKATFLADHPGATEHTIEGAPPNDSIAGFPTIAGLTFSGDLSGDYIRTCDDGFFGTPFNCIAQIGGIDGITITFSSAINCFGFYVNKNGGSGGVTLDFYNGVTLVSSNGVSTAGDYTVFTSFYGYGW
jgi:hypothetical protein